MIVLLFNLGNCFELNKVTKPKLQTLTANKLLDCALPVVIISWKQILENHTNKIYFSLNHSILIKSKKCEEEENKTK